MPDQDATARIQQVLDRAGRDGGGIVYLRAGWYRVTGHLQVPKNVELRGASAVPNRDQLGASGGTVLMAYEGRGATDSATALITLEDRAGVRGLRIFYPENNPAGPDGLVSYPYAIRATGNAAYTIDTGMPNAWNGIDAQGNGFTARKVTGAFFDHAITVTGDHTRIEGLLSNGNAVTRVGYAVPNWANERDIFPQVIDKYMRPRSKLVTAVDAHDLTVLNAFGYGFHDGIKASQSDLKAFNLGTDNLGTGGYTVDATGGTTTATNVLRYNGSTSTGPVTLINLMAINMLQATISVQATGNGTASIEGNETEPGRYERGSQITAVATGTGFQGWTRDGQVVSNDPRYSLTVDGDLTLTAVFG